MVQLVCIYTIRICVQIAKKLNSVYFLFLEAGSCVFFEIKPQIYAVFVRIFEK